MGLARASRPAGPLRRYAITPRFAYSGFHLAPWYSPHYREGQRLGALEVPFVVR